MEQIAATMAALGLYDGESTPQEHAAEAVRLGGPDAYRVRRVNALLGVVQAEAAMADAVRIDADAHVSAWEEQLKAAGAGVDDPVRRVEFLRWQVLCSGTPVREMATNHGAGPIPLAAAHTARLCTCCSA